MRDRPDGVVATAAAVRSGVATAADIVASHLEAARSAQPTLNAFTFLDDRALTAAERIDAMVAEGEDPGALAGVPIAVKDLIDQAGLPNSLGTSGVPAMPERSATVITRLEGAGAVIIGRTGLHEYAFGFSGENHWHGPVRNPWDTSLSPGGSSGGSAAAVAAHLAAGSIGTDTGGSIRVPAALCGLVGLKVTHGRVSLHGVYPLAESVDTVGPLARGVADAAALYEVMAGHDPADRWSAEEDVATSAATAVLRELRFGVPHPWVDTRLDEAQATAFSDAINMLTSAGSEVVELFIPILDPPGEIEGALYPEVASVHRERFRAHPESYGPEVAARVEASLAVDLAAEVRGQAWAAAVRTAMNDALDTVDVLITPTVAALHKTIGEDTIMIEGEPTPYAAALSHFTALVNQARLPAIALPLVSSGTPPPSIQLIGPPWSEGRLLEIARAFEAGGLVATRRPARW